MKSNQPLAYLMFFAILGGLGIARAAYPLQPVHPAFLFAMSMAACALLMESKGRTNDLVKDWQRDVAWPVLVGISPLFTYLESRTFWAFFVVTVLFAVRNLRSVAHPAND